ncbi:MAG TPA: dihydrolipoyl dehydrogenase [Verrucomicrobiales bacterium]|nr:dihydrolipoyl dehydrogenase [Verrucomicrobiales bacterium]
MDPIKTEVVVLGAGPGGYAAAFYAADLGKKVMLIEQEQRLGGVCLNRGCIPSKALLHATRMVEDAAASASRGISFGAPTIQLDKLRAWKESILTKLSGGIAGLAQKRGVQVLHARGHFEGSNTLRVETSEGQTFVNFEKAIIAVGSRPALPRAFDLGNPRIMTSTEALDIPEIPGSLLVIGGGYIGMELGTVYSSLGSKVTVVEALDSILAGADADLVRPVLRYAEKHFTELRVKAKVASMSTAGKQIKVVTECDGQRREELYDRVLVSVGRVPNAEDLGLENTLVQRDERGFITVDSRMQTTDPSLYAIGDIAGGVLLAHKASKEARIAVENLAGESSLFSQVTIPAVVFTHPEIAWCGLTEAEAKAKGRAVEIAKFPWAASGRALTCDATEGVTKLIIDPETERILGVGITGEHAGDMISEGVALIEMGATVKDLAEMVHPHPTLSESLMEAAEAFYGHCTHIHTRRKVETVAAAAAGH